MTHSFTPCSVEGCEDRATGRGLCNPHYQRWYRWGDPLISYFTQNGDPEARFFKWVVAGANGCWIWIGHRSWGYGKFWVDGHNVMAHRWIYERYVGKIPSGLQLDHFACDNGAGGCVNPYHCRPVTPRENTLRGRSIQAMNAAKTHCVHGHPFSTENTKIRSDGSRACRTCLRDADRRYRESHRV